MRYNEYGVPNISSLAVGGSHNSIGHYVKSKDRGKQYSAQIDTVVLSHHD